MPTLAEVHYQHHISAVQARVELEFHVLLNFAAWFVPVASKGTEGKD